MYVNVTEPITSERYDLATDSATVDLETWHICLLSWLNSDYTTGGLEDLVRLRVLINLRANDILAGPRTIKLVAPGLIRQYCLNYFLLVSLLLDADLDSKSSLFDIQLLFDKALNQSSPDDETIRCFLHLIPRYIIEEHLKFFLIR